MGETRSSAKDRFYWVSATSRQPAELQIQNHRLMPDKAFRQIAKFAIKPSLRPPGENA
jgi:hypothetical protein